MKVKLKKKKETAKQIALKEITQEAFKNYVYVEKKVLEACSQPKIVVNINFN